MTLLFDIPVPSLAITGRDERFPVRRVLCVGRNYAAHAREMGFNEREAPFFFSKPATAVIHENDEVPYPSRTRDLHHEVELVVALEGGGRDLSPQQAEKAIYGHATGIDFTRRDLQAQAKEHGRPWDVAKGFDHSAPVSAIRPVSETGQLRKGSIQLRVNGELRQDGDLEDMIWNVPEIIAELSTYYCLEPGDIIFTGTPSGVSSVSPGDRLDARIEGLEPLSVRLVEPLRS